MPPPARFQFRWGHLQNSERWFDQVFIWRALLSLAITHIWANLVRYTNPDRENFRREKLKLFTRALVCIELAHCSLVETIFSVMLGYYYIAVTVSSAFPCIFILWTLSKIVDVRLLVQMQEHLWTESTNEECVAVVPSELFGVNVWLMSIFVSLNLLAFPRTMRSSQEFSYFQRI
jgi:hypothetical protein